jgi:Putative restriction endonuclease
MTGASKNPEISEADYLAAELIAQEKHEYVSGQVFAMSGASIRHNQIAINVLIALRSPCRVSISDVKFKGDLVFVVKRRCARKNYLYISIIYRLKLCIARLA